MDDLVDTYLAWKSGQFDNGLQSVPPRSGDNNLSVRAVDFFREYICLCQPVPDVDLCM